MGKNKREESRIQSFFYDSEINEISGLKIIIIILAASTIFFTILELIRNAISYRAENLSFKIVSLISVCMMVILATTVIYSLHIYFNRKKNMALKEQINILQTILDDIPCPVFYKDTKGIFRGCNNAFEKFTGLNKKDAIGKTAFDSVPSETAIRCFNKDIELLNNPGFQTYVTPFLLSSGETHEVILNKATYSNSNGIIQGIVCVITDINERIKMENELKESEEKYKCLVELSSDLIAIHDYEKIIFINEKGAKMIGANSADEIIGTRLEEFIHPAEESVQNNYIEELKKGNELPITENRYIRRDGSEIILEFSAEPFVYMGKKAVHLLARDISLRKKTEELNRRLDETIEYDKLRTEFFANISHELRTPLNVILSAVQMENVVLKGCESDIENRKRLYKYTDIIKQNSFRLIRLINNLIDVTKIDAGYFQINLKNWDFVSLVENIALSVADYIQSKGIDLIFDTNIEEKIIACDPEKIERVLLNLLSNAVKFTDTGGKIYVTVEARSDKVILHVKDTGIGIPYDKQSMVFERFVQVDKSLSRNYEGSGIGLSLVKSFVEMHNGSIRINSEYKNGTEFIVEIPSFVLPDNGDNEKNKELIQVGNIEKIKLEFSDIYL